MESQNPTCDNNSRSDRGSVDDEIAGFRNSTHKISIKSEESVTLVTPSGKTLYLEYREGQPYEWNGVQCVEEDQFSVINLDGKRTEMQSAGVDYPTIACELTGNMGNRHGSCEEGFNGGNPVFVLLINV